MHRWFRFRRGMTLGVRGIAEDATGRIFLVRHTYLPGWHLPGGGIEVGQTAEDALVQELGEEGHLVLDGPAQLIGVYLNRPTSPRDHVLLYRARVIQTAPRLPDHEIAESGFFARDALPEGTTPATRRRLAEAFEGVPLDRFWTPDYSGGQRNRLAA